MIANPLALGDEFGPGQQGQKLTCPQSLVGENDGFGNLS
jgi:hypothetical protein